MRDMLFQVLENEEDVVIKHGAQSRESRREATKGMHSSKFCLHPAGDTPSACRLFDAIVSSCIPVVVSDYVELPFEDVIDYRKISIFVDTNSAVKPGHLVKLLRRLSTERILEFQQELKKVLNNMESLCLCLCVEKGNYKGVQYQYAKPSFLFKLHMSYTSFLLSLFFSCCHHCHS